MPVKVQSIEDVSSVNGAGKQPPPDLLKQNPNDYGNGQRLIAMHGADIRYCPAMKKWLVYDLRRWAVDEGGTLARKLAHTTMRQFAHQAVDHGDEDAAKFAVSCLNTQRLHNALTEAAPYLAVSPDQLDSDADLLNFCNGTMNLKTGEFNPHRREDLITKLVAHDYAPDAECPLFLCFLDRIMGGSDHLVGYLKKALGYSMTARTIEKAVFLLHGGGDNGKTTLLSLFLKLLKEYAVLIQIDSLMTRQESNNTQADLADLRGARFVMTSETEAGQRLSEGKLKRITTGMSRVKAVRKYENPIEFPESHKLWIDSNHLPVVRGTDNAIWNRLHPVPFTVKIPKIDQDPELPQKLLSEAEGILAWAAAGAKKWYEERLGKPDAVEEAGKKWRADSDQIGRFIVECCVILPNAQVRGKTLYAAYKKWAEESTEKEIMTQTAFGDRMTDLSTDLGFHKDRSNVVTYLRIGLRADKEV